MYSSRKKSEKFALSLFFAMTLFSSYILIPKPALAQTTLNQGFFRFDVIPFSFVFTGLAGKGTNYDFVVSWTVRQNDPSQPLTGIKCIFIGSSTVDCGAQPIIQGPGPGSCTVHIPPYDFTKLNNVSCFVYYTPSIFYNATYNISFNPVAFNAVAALGSLTVGTAIPLRVHVQNTGLLTDLYTVNFTSASSYILFSDPNTNTGSLDGIPTNESGYAQSDVTAQAAFGSQSVIIIQVNSTVSPSIGQTIPIYLSAGLASLPDFTIFGIIQIIILAALVLWAKK
jgi:hypothetical protein